ncbi:hypothetical protein CL622_05065, partial [archaeon]|nr:hypothetical protein [archaeon]
MHSLLKKGKRVLTSTVVLTTMVWAVGVFGISLSATAAVSGDLIKITCTGSNASVCDAVYYLGSDSKRYVFPNEKSFLTWYSDFSSVQGVSQEEMQTYTIGGNVTYRPGVKMVKITTDPKVYAVAANGTLRHVASEAVAVALYGSNWNQMIDDVADSFFVNYTVGSAISAASDFDKAAETSSATSINVDKGLGVVSGTGLTVALASDTPATGIVVGNVIRVPFTKVNFTASSDGDVTIDSMVVKRTGTAAQDGAFATIAFINAGTNEQIGLNKNLNSVHTATLNDDIVVKAGTTLSVMLSGNMASSLSSYAGEIPSLSLDSVTLKGGAVLNGSLPITGNYMTMNSTIEVG